MRIHIFFSRLFQALVEFVDNSLIMTRSSGFLSALQILSLLSSSLALPSRSQIRDAEFASAKDQTYDYIIVGGGLTGLVVANRLTEQKGSKSYPSATFIESMAAYKLNRNSTCS